MRKGAKTKFNCKIDKRCIVAFDVRSKAASAPPVSIASLTIPASTAQPSECVVRPNAFDRIETTTPPIPAPSCDQKRAP